jgi:hypothetical protein
MLVCRFSHCSRCPAGSWLRSPHRSPSGFWEIKACSPGARVHVESGHQESRHRLHRDHRDSRSRVVRADHPRGGPREKNGLPGEQAPVFLDSETIKTDPKLNVKKGIKALQEYIEKNR